MKLSTSSVNRKERKEAAEKLISRPWKLNNEILGLLDAAARPAELAAEFGIKGSDYYLSPEQVDAILELRLHRLTGLATEEVINEYKELLVKIAETSSHQFNSPVALDGSDS